MTDPTPVSAISGSFKKRCLERGNVRISPLPCVVCKGKTLEVRSPDGKRYNQSYMKNKDGTICKDVLCGKCMDTKSHNEYEYAIQTDHAMTKEQLKLASIPMTNKEKKERFSG